MQGLLRGLRVVECASFIAAPSCTLHLQQLGAEVIRIDPIGGGPDRHRWPLARDGASLYWEGLNKGKRSVAVNFATPEGRDLVVRLVTAAGAGGGIFVTNFPAGGFLSHEQLRRLRPDLITVRVTGWPDGGTAVDYTVNAAIGIPSMTGPVDADGPVNHVLPAWDLLAGAYASFALMAALRHREHSGAGQEVRVPLSDVAISALANMGQVAEVLEHGDRPRLGNQLFGAFGHDFRTADGQRLMVVAITPRQWSGLVAALRLGDAVAGVERQVGISFATDEGLRFSHADRLVPLVASAIAARPAAVLATSFDEHGVCWSTYRTLAEAVRDDARLVAGNPMFRSVQHPGHRTYPTPGAPASLSGGERLAPQPAPRLGEHTGQVLRELLDLSPPAISRLRAEGHVGGVVESAA